MIAFEDLQAFLSVDDINRVTETTCREVSVSLKFVHLFIQPFVSYGADCSYLIHRLD